MSYDINLINPATDEEYDSRNITYNLAKMFIEAGCYPKDLIGKTGQETAAILALSIKKMVDDPSYFKQFNATNGWGTYQQALPWLCELKELCETYPDCVILVT